MRLSITPILVFALAAIFWTTVIYSGVGEGDHVTFDTPETALVPAVADDLESNGMRRSLLTQLEFEELNLRLLGVVSFQGDTSCYLRHPGQENHMTYRLGDVIGGYRIVQIQNQAVVFEREGLRLWLMLGDNEESAEIAGEAFDATPGNGFEDGFEDGLINSLDAGFDDAPEFLSNPVFTADHDGLDAEEIADEEGALELEAAALAVELKKAQGRIKNTTEYYESASLIEDGSKTRPKPVAGLSQSANSSLFISPIKARVTSPFGYRRHPVGGGRRFHSGIDLAGPYGTNILAAAGGKVVDVSRSAGLGRYVKIRHNNGFETVYGHLSRQLVKEGQTVNQGQVIGREGSTGISTGPHLHFEIRKNGKPVNPESYVKFR